MIAILFNLGTQAPDIALGYNDFLAHTAHELGYGWDADDWTSDQLTEIRRFVDRGYREVYNPPVLPGERLPHIWSCTRPVTTLTTVASTSDYTLPTDLASIESGFTFAAAQGKASIEQTAEHKIREWRAWGTQSGYPRYFATRWRAQTTGLDQRQEVLFYPTPDAAYVLTYRYAATPLRLSTTNPYPLGGARMSELVLMACRAVAQEAKDGELGSLWSLFMERLTAAIQLDKRTLATPTLGPVRDPFYERNSRPFEPEYDFTVTYVP